MANITSSFTHLLPTELYVAGISTNITGSYTYNGPETFDVWVDSNSGIVTKVDVSTDPPAEAGADKRKTINAKDSAQLPAAYALSHQFHQDYQWDYTFTDETQSNGDVYKKINNPDLRDAYEVKYDFTTSTWTLVQILKELRNDAALEAKKRKDYVSTYSDQYDFGTDINTKITTYLAALDTFIGNNPDYKTWKFVTLPDASGTMPKIPVEIQIELNKVSMNGVGGLV